MSYDFIMDTFTLLVALLSAGLALRRVRINTESLKGRWLIPWILVALANIVVAFHAFFKTI